MSEVKFDSWRQDLMFEDRIERDVLFIRASLLTESGRIEYHCPVWEEELVEEAKAILKEHVLNHETT